MTLRTRLYIGVVVAGGLGVLPLSLLRWESQNPYRFAVLLLVTLLVSGFKVSLPSVTGTMSVYFQFILIGILQLSLPEVLVMGAGATLVQCLWHTRRRPRLVQIAFNIASTSLAIALSHWVAHLSLFDALSFGMAARLAAAAVVFFIMNTGPVAIVIALTEGKSPRQVWQECYFWCFPYYLVGASIAGLFNYLSGTIGWETALLVVPVVYVIYRSYHLYLGKLENEKVHAEQMASLHLRTIEALALAIDAKDHTTGEHLQRVQVYAVEIAKELGLSREQTAALQAAALLHDIGKLAVPEHIISKPGRLTPEEFEKMKIHPVVGAEILDRVKFPYPVVPIVRAHHERWDGSGYPDGLKGEEIPIGARILSVVDCLDALASDRQYRRALSLEDALKVVVSESGKSFEPRVTEVLQRRYREFEALSQGGEKSIEPARLSQDFRVERGQAPAAGFEASGPAHAARPGQPGDFLQSIAAARQEAQGLFELAQALGNSLSLSDTLSVLAGRLQRLVHYDALAVYVVRGSALSPEFCIGEDLRLFSSLNIPLGQGISGWVAENRQPIINGNPSVEPGYLNNPKIFSKLNSALSVPLLGEDSVVGVLTLYHADRDAFSRDQLRVLQAISSKLSVSVGNALRFKEAEASATTDFLTSLPNARSLFLHLDAEIARCERSGTTLSVMVCDLDGFKRVNDRFGHLSGNRVLNLFASRIRERCRSYDYVARMGGDEFVVLLSGLTPEIALAKTGEFDQIARQVGREICGEEIVSLSSGVAVFPADGKNAEEMLAEADRRMYREKHLHTQGNPVAGSIKQLVKHLEIVQ
ncbi:MAG: diguanylate cyclase [Acidobacteria bacterium]|nr:diguanylate cyclase [Acidobacteriota bacterium]